MAEIAMTVYQLNRVGGVNVTDLATAATAGNNYNIPNDGNTRIYALCAGGGTASVNTPNSVDGNLIAELTLTLTGTKAFIFGPWPINVYGATMIITVSAATSLIAFRG
jgi:hypothetical protein